MNTYLFMTVKNITSFTGGTSTRGSQFLPKGEIMNNLPNWDTVKTELKNKWYIVVICAIAGAYQGLCYLIPALPNIFKF